MVSLAVVGAAFLAVLVLVFSDQPATAPVDGLGGGRSWPAGPRQPALAANVAHRFPPSADVLQRGLALPSPRRSAPRHRTDASDGGAVGASGRDRPSAVRIGVDERATFLTRMRSSLELLVLLAAVGTAVALGIGAVLFLASLALRHTLR